MFVATKFRMKLSRLLIHPKHMEVWLSMFLFSGYGISISVAMTLHLLFHEFVSVAMYLK